MSHTISPKKINTYDRHLENGITYSDSKLLMETVNSQPIFKLEPSDYKYNEHAKYQDSELLNNSMTTFSTNNTYIMHDLLKLTALSESEGKYIYQLNIDIPQHVIINNLHNNSYNNTNTLLYSYVIFKEPIKNISLSFMNHMIDNLSNIITQHIDSIYNLLYIKYKNTYMHENLCKHFYKNRIFVFLKQYLNDRELFKYNNMHDEMITHFINWFNNTDDYLEKSEIIDVLLKHAPNNDVVQNMLRRLRYNNTNNTNKINIKTIADDKQNVHDSKIHSDSIKFAAKLIIDMTKYNDVNIIEYLTKENIYHKHKQLCDIVYNRIVIDTSTFTHNKFIFTTFDLFTAIIKYISNSKHKSELNIRLIEEFNEMKNYCISGHLTRLMNIFKGFDENYSVYINFKTQLNCIIKAFIESELKKLSEDISSKIIMGTYDSTYYTKYVNFLEELINNNLDLLHNEYGENDVNDNIINILNKLTKSSKWEFTEKYKQIILNEKVYIIKNLNVIAKYRFS